MKNGKVKPDPNAPETRLLVSDIARYLNDLAGLHGKDKTGNQGLSAGLRLLAQAIHPYAKYPVVELPEVIKALPGGKAADKSNKAAFPPEVAAALESLSQEDVAQILDDPGSAKGLVAELGFRRFGISRAKLERLSKQAARDAVRSALENERILDAISEEARKSGQARLG